MVLPLNAALLSKLKIPVLTLYRIGAVLPSAARTSASLTAAISATLIIFCVEPTLILLSSTVILETITPSSLTVILL